MPNIKDTHGVALALCVALLALVGCATPISDTVANPMSTAEKASGQSTLHGTLRDDGSVITATNPNGENYTVMDDRGVYTSQVLAHGSAAIGAKGVFASDPRNTAADIVAIDFTAHEVPLVLFDEDGVAYVVPDATTYTVVPSKVRVEGFNTDLATVYLAAKELASVEAEKFLAMEETERQVFLEEIKQRGETYRYAFAAALELAGEQIPTGLIPDPGD